jgi:hypothetical protein
MLWASAARVLRERDEEAARDIPGAAGVLRERDERAESIDIPSAAESRRREREGLLERDENNPSAAGVLRERDEGDLPGAAGVLQEVDEQLEAESMEAINAMLLQAAASHPELVQRGLDMLREI